MRKSCKYKECKCRHYEETICNGCNHGAIWHNKPKKDIEDKLCLICYENKKDCLLLPCKHYLICSNCSEQINRCPYCCEDIQNKITGIYD